jgi:hypothetical protein
MKKVFALLSLVAFLSVSALAQTAAPADTKADTKAAHSCCAKPNASCCKNNKEAKSCTSEQKAACEKASKSCSPTQEVKKDEKK